MCNDQIRWYDSESGDQEKWCGWEYQPSLSRFVVISEGLCEAWPEGTSPMLDWRQGDQDGCPDNGWLAPEPADTGRLQW